MSAHDASDESAVQGAVRGLLADARRRLDPPPLSASQSREVDEILRRLEERSSDR